MDLTDCRIFGVSVWDARLDGAIQKDLVISRHSAPKITVDNLEVAQFIHLLLTNEKIRHVIDTIARKVILILGRFTDERLRILRRIREKLRAMNYSPVLFDFEAPAEKDWIETVKILAHMSRFVIHGPHVTEANKTRNGSHCRPDTIAHHSGLSPRAHRWRRKESLVR